MFTTCSGNNVVLAEDNVEVIISAKLELYRFGKTWPIESAEECLESRLKGRYLCRYEDGLDVVHLFYAPYYLSPIFEWEMKAIRLHVSDKNPSTSDRMKH